MKVTFFKNVFDKNAPHHVSVSTALDRIKKGQSKTTIDAVRSGNKDAKKKLPVVCFSGEFASRADDALFEHSSLLVLDFDHIDVAQAKGALATDDYVYSCWVSPSGDGLKALVKVTNPERHRDHFRALRTYFHKQYDLEVDESGVNESRACFESYDPDLILNPESKAFGAFASEKSEKPQEAKVGEFTDYMKLNLACRMVRQAEEGEKHAALLKASKLVGGYISAGRLEEEEAVRVLFREICKRDIDSEDAAMTTIRQAIEVGKRLPIRAVIDNEQEAQRELLINDGDMSFISSDDEDFRWIDDYANGKIPVGLSTGDDRLDDFFRYKKEFLIMNGHSNVGKTTFALYMMVNSAVRHGWKWVVYSSENRTASLKMSLMQFAVNRRIADMNYDQRKAAYKWVNEHFTVISNNQVYSYSDIIVFLEKIVRQQDCDAVFVDPYNSLKIELTGNGSSHDYHYQAASEFLTFSTTNDVAVWLNMHAVTEAQRRKGDDGLPVAPFAEDTEGGGKFVNRADCFITVHRKVQAPDHNIKKTTELHIRKVRETETGGQPTSFDDPITFTMNTAHTAFRINTTGKELFQSIDKEFDNYEKFNMPTNIDFFGKSAVTSHSEATNEEIFS
mgnify:FL=1|jgi:hypothetical protein|tara:strand:- start:1786 stop:3639 length:1854 start_codon:yes stop_codon:yes gene_type:complete